MSEINSEANSLMFKTGRLLVELANHAGISWDNLYISFASMTNEYWGGLECTYRNGRFLEIIDAEFGDQTFKKLEVEIIDTINNIFKLIELEKGKKPLVISGEIDKDNNFTAKFDYKNSKNLSVGKMELGTEFSYFQNNEVDIPEYIKEQHELHGKSNA